MMMMMMMMRDGCDDDMMDVKLNACYGKIHSGTS
jgi:hypothetical protein